MERIRRAADIQFAACPPGGSYDPSHPWDYVFHKAVNDETFWQGEVERKCILFLARAAPLVRLTSDGTAFEGPITLSGNGPRHFDAAQTPNTFPQGNSQGRKNNHNKKKNKKGSGPNPFHGSSGYGSGGKGQTPKSNPRGEICNNYNHGKCKDPCPHERIHKCSSCGAAHPAKDCSGGKKGGGKRA